MKAMRTGKEKKQRVRNRVLGKGKQPAEVNQGDIKHECEWVRV